MFKQMLKMLSLDFICNYDSLILKDTKKINKLAFALDMAVAGRSDESVWIRQAQEIQRQMTDSLIDSAFTYLPEGVKHDEIELIKNKVLERLDEREKVIIEDYYQRGKKIKVIATERNLSEVNVKQILFRAREKIKSNAKKELNRHIEQRKDK